MIPLSRRSFLSATAMLQQVRRPNVLLILADDLGSADVGFAGGEVTTPHIDRIAREGVRFTNFYATPLCTPTRASLMTGRNPVRYGLIYSVIRPWSAYGVPIDERMMSEAFHDGGYQTAAIGKWHLGHTHPRFHPNARGFDHFYGHMNAEIDYFTHTKLDGLDWQRNGKGVREAGYSTQLLGDEAVRWLQQRDRGRPFFLYLPFNAVHAPMQAPALLLEKYAGSKNPARRAYLAMLEAMDGQIGRVLDVLQKDGSLDDTIVVFLSDNGGALGQGARNGTLRAGKLTVYEGGVKVCAAMRYPRHLRPGSVNEAVLSVLDLFPTLASAAGVKVGRTKELDGRDVWRSLSDGSRLEPREMFWAAKKNEVNERNHAVRVGDWKLVELIGADGLARRQLFDLRADPEEKHDLAGSRPQELRQLGTALEQWKNLHPRVDVDSSMNPHPGWVAPADYADMGH